MSTPPRPASALRNVRHWGGAAGDILISETGEITTIEPAAHRPAAPADITKRVLVDAEKSMDALARTPLRELVLGAGRLLYAA